MEQMANVNNRYMWAAEEVKLFLALIEEKKTLQLFKMENAIQLYIRTYERILSKGYDKHWNVCTFSAPTT